MSNLSGEKCIELFLLVRLNDASTTGPQKISLSLGNNVVITDFGMGAGANLGLVVNEQVARGGGVVVIPNDRVGQNIFKYALLTCGIPLSKLKSGSLKHIMNNYGTAIRAAVYVRNLTTFTENLDISMVQEAARGDDAARRVLKALDKTARAHLRTAYDRAETALKKSQEGGIKSTNASLAHTLSSNDDWKRHLQDFKQVQLQLDELRKDVEANELKFDEFDSKLLSVEGKLEHLQEHAIKTDSKFEEIKAVLATLVEERNNSKTPNASVGQPRPLDVSFPMPSSGVSSDAKCAAALQEDEVSKLRRERDEAVAQNKVLATKCAHACAVRDGTIEQCKETLGNLRMPSEMTAIGFRVQLRMAEKSRVVDALEHDLKDLFALQYFGENAPFDMKVLSEQDVKVYKSALMDLSIAVKLAIADKPSTLLHFEFPTSELLVGAIDLNDQLRMTWISQANKLHHRALDFVNNIAPLFGQSLIKTFQGCSEDVDINRGKAALKEAASRAPVSSEEVIAFYCGSERDGHEEEEAGVSFASKQDDTEENDNDEDSGGDNSSDSSFDAGF